MTIDIDIDIEPHLERVLIDVAGRHGMTPAGCCRGALLSALEGGDSVADALAGCAEDFPGAGNVQGTGAAFVGSLPLVTRVR